MTYWAVLIVSLSTAAIGIGISNVVTRLDLLTLELRRIAVATERLERWHRKPAKVDEVK